MTAQPTLAATAVIAALRASPPDPLVTTAIEAIEAGGEVVLNVGESSADILHKTLATKYELARGRGLIINGADRVLERLGQLGATLTKGVVLNHRGRHITVFMLGDTLEVIGVAIREPFGSVEAR